MILCIDSHAFLSTKRATIAITATSGLYRQPLLLDILFPAAYRHIDVGQQAHH